MSQSYAVDEILKASTSPATDIDKIKAALDALQSRFSGTSRPTGDALVAGSQWLDTDYDTNAWALYTVVDSANSGKDTLEAIIETSTGKWLAPGNSESVSVDCSAGGNITLSALEDAYGVVNLTGTPGAAFNLIVSTRKLARKIVNGADATATVKTSGGTGVDVDAGTELDTRCDGTNVQRLVPKPDELISARQTILSAAVGGSGEPTFVTIGTGLSVNVLATSIPLIFTAAGGTDENGEINRIGRVPADTTISGLPASSTSYLYADIAAGGAVTLGSTTLAPIYQWGGTYSTTNGQFTFNIQRMVGRLGDGSSSSQAFRVYFGEADTDATSVTSVRRYAVLSRYESGSFAIANNSSYTKSHLLGVPPEFIETSVYVREDGTQPWGNPNWMYVGAGAAYGASYGVVNRISIRVDTAADYVGAAGWSGFSAVSTTGVCNILARRIF